LNKHFKLISHKTMTFLAYLSKENIHKLGLDNNRV
jgi:hypothetical protein